MKIYAIHLCYYTEENVPEHGATIFVRSNEDVTKLEPHIIKENIYVAEAMEKNDCEGIGFIYEIPEKEFYEEYDEELIELFIEKTVYLLVETDGYSISYERYESLADARKALKKAWDSHYDDDMSDDWKNSSSFDEDSAILYDNGENVYVWEIIKV